MEKKIKTKICTKCKQEKELLGFYESVSNKDGFSSHCKKCISIAGKRRYKENPEKSSERSKRWYKKNSEKSKEKSRKKYKENPEKEKKYQKKWRKENPEKKREQSRRWRKNNPEKQKAIQSRCYNKNKNNPNYKVRNSVRRLINFRLKKRLTSKGGLSTFTFLPYTIEELMQHLEKQFQPKMTWNNYGMFGWHIDHIRPDSSFNYKSVEDEEFQECWALKNLQPLWARDNYKKGAKIINEKFL